MAAPRASAISNSRGRPRPLETVDDAALDMLSLWDHSFPKSRAFFSALDGCRRRRLRKTRVGRIIARIRINQRENASMSALSRRNFLALTGSAAATMSGRLTTAADAAM